MYGYRLAPTQYRFWFLVIQQYAISINDDWAQRLRVNKIRILFFRGISHFAMHEYFFRDHEYISSIFHVKLGRCRVLPNPICATATNIPIISVLLWMILRHVARTMTVHNNNNYNRCFANVTIIAN